MKKIFTFKGMAIAVILLITTIAASATIYGKAMRNELEGLAADGYYIKERPVEHSSLVKKTGCIYPRQEQTMRPFL
ncbi:MAG TPA: hypothetical protein DEA46_05595 [Candidatus Moranbacteria bacterium]|nr:hypothetical protein [Candidatus Moranbacteria bacterium]